MANFAPDLIGSSWRQAYRWALSKFDLRPFFLSAPWTECDLEEGSQVTLSVQVAHDYWWHGLAISAIYQQEQSGHFGPMHPQYLQMQIYINGQLASGTWADPAILQGDETFLGLGPGYYLPKGSIVRFDIRRAFPMSSEAISSQYLGVTLHGCELFPLGSDRYLCDGSEIRNLSREDWNRSAILGPSYYADLQELDMSEVGSRVRLSIRTRNRPFLCDRIQFYQYPREGTEAEPQGAPYVALPADADIYVDEAPWNGQDSPVQCAGVGGFASYNPIMCRIPRIIPPASQVSAWAGGWPWASEENAARVGMHLSGYDLQALGGE